MRLFLLALLKPKGTLINQILFAIDSKIRIDTLDFLYFSARRGCFVFDPKSLGFCLALRLRIIFLD